jgi:hypothetical protein
MSRRHDRDRSEASREAEVPVTVSLVREVCAVRGFFYISYAYHELLQHHVEHPQLPVVVVQRYPSLFRLAVLRFPQIKRNQITLLRR